MKDELNQHQQFNNFVWKRYSYKFQTKLFLHDCAKYNCFYTAFKK